MTSVGRIGSGLSGSDLPEDLTVFLEVVFASKKEKHCGSLPVRKIESPLKYKILHMSTAPLSQISSAPRRASRRQPLPVALALGLAALLLSGCAAAPGMYVSAAMGSQGDAPAGALLSITPELTPTMPAIYHLDASSPVAYALADGFELKARDVVN